MSLAEGVRWEVDSNVDEIPARKRDIYQARIAILMNICGASTARFD